ncbi:MAG TPA: ABC transporter ATP-binding protein [Desulfobacteraceae bacterium]|nr:ABC transporter ATP-binding protein [Desulfobacteraceae bacterium]
MNERAPGDSGLPDKPAADASITPTLSVEGVRRYFPVQRGFFRRTVGWIKAVDGVSLWIPAGKTLALVGESGCGKTTVAKLVLRLLDADEGKIVFQGVDIGAIHRKQLQSLRRRMQIVFQDPYGSLNPRMTAGQSIAEGLLGLEMDKKKRASRVEELLSLVGLGPESAGRYPHEFSGGQRQRIGIARALSVNPSLIVCDEPVSALDVSIQAQIINLLEDLQDRLGLSYLFISHDLNLVGYLSDMVAVMYLGQIMETAPSETLFDNPVHPYTKALLSAVPVPEPGRGFDSEILSGDVPSPLDPPPGCKFQGRCPLVENRCRQEEIPFFETGPDHLVRCWKTTGN